MPGATWGAPAGHTTRPSGAGARGAAVSPSAASVGEPVEIAHGSLRTLASGRCLDVRGGRVAAGASPVLTACSPAPSQQWSYQDDGLLRSAADPALCLVADPGTKSVAVDDCVVHAGEVSYDVAAGGEILLRWHKGLLVAAGSGRSATRVAVADRDGSRVQRWAIEPDEGGRPDATAAPNAPDGERRGVRAGGPGASPGRRGDGDSSPPGYPGRGSQGLVRGGETRIAQVGVHADPPSAGPAASGAAGDAAGAVEAVGRHVQPVTDALASTAGETGPGALASAAGGTGSGGRRAVGTLLG
ncbi:RICIN domain-containing protein [Streptomyces sp. AF1A]|uniref:RICIN domain-containing protein n=1 Tax=Streptomyces sp. AF1A TaxID=3394350 RepID=UPI0039BD54CB